MTTLLDLLDEHKEAPAPEDTKDGRVPERIDPTQIDADICEVVTSYVSGVGLDSNSRQQLEQNRLELGESWHALPSTARPYYSRLLLMADVAVQGCEEIPSPPPPLADNIDLVARVACNGEVMWARSHAEQAIRALSDAGFEILGLDLRRYPPSGGTQETAWSSIEPAATTNNNATTTNVNQALRSLNAALASDLSDCPWVLVTYR